MSNETDRIRLTGPRLFTFGYTTAGREERKIGGKIHGNVIVTKTDVGDEVCIDRKRNLCRICVDVGWAAKNNCQNPLTSSDNTNSPTA